MTAKVNGWITKILNGPVYIIAILYSSVLIGLLKLVCANLLGNWPCRRDTLMRPLPSSSLDEYRLETQCMGATHSEQRRQTSTFHYHLVTTKKHLQQGQSCIQAKQRSDFGGNKKAQFTMKCLQTTTQSMQRFAFCKCTGSTRQSS
ncbi:hypothetical protein T4C_476 [Trichinella pseudospiralis]|uniref:Uncharacterized protein n=1 Tax=Trichinella pseudospiralis TaxID=6337 RepID=A0A0V1KAI3_TRIPS|nr:hypothetical protein T4C_476 [Trichinella pseudospiralis]